MEIERQLRDFNRRVEKDRGEIRARLERLQQSCKEAGEERRREWEELKGRVMTAEERRRHESDEFLRLMATMTDEHVKIVRAVGEDLKQGFAEVQSEGRAHREALLRLLDRLPPREGEGG